MARIEHPDSDWPRERQHARTLSAELHEIAERFRGRPVTWSELLAAMQGRGWFMALLFLSLPFLAPIPIPLLSTAFGLVIGIVGLRLALGLRPWVPHRWLRRELQPETLTKLINVTGRLVRGLEFFLRPRLRFMQRAVVARRLVGAMIAISGLLLLLPLPIPFSNTLPAWTVMLLAAGVLERDGVFWLLGTFVFLLTQLFFAALAIGGAQAIDAILHAIGL